MAQGDETYPPLLPQHLYLSSDVFAGHLKNYGQVLPDVSGKEHTLPDLAVNRQSDEPLQALKDFRRPLKDGFCCVPKVWDGAKPCSVSCSKTA